MLAHAATHVDARAARRVTANAGMDRAKVRPGTLMQRHQICNPRKSLMRSEGAGCKHPNFVAKKTEET